MNENFWQGTAMVILFLEIVYYIQDLIAFNLKSCDLACRIGFMGWVTIVERSEVARNGALFGTYALRIVDSTDSLLSNFNSYANVKFRSISNRAST